MDGLEGVVGEDARMPVITEPVDRESARSLREAVLDYRGRGARPGPTLVHVGRPGGSSASLAVGRQDVVDAALCTDVVGALLVRHLEDAVGVDPVWVWLARPGPLAWQDADATWLGAASAAYAEAGRDLTFVVVARVGWRDPRSGVGVEWRRLRDRRTS